MRSIHVSIVLVLLIKGATVVGADNPETAVRDAHRAKMKQVAQSIEITDAEPPTKVNMNLTMLTPIEAHNLVEFTLRADNNATEVTWAMTGHHRPLIAKIMDVLFNMDRMVGGQFEKGLEDLKAVAEG